VLEGGRSEVLSVATSNAHARVTITARRIQFWLSNLLVASAVSGVIFRDNLLRDAKYNGSGSGAVVTGTLRSLIHRREKVTIAEACRTITCLRVSGARVWWVGHRRALRRWRRAGGESSGIRHHCRSRRHPALESRRRSYLTAREVWAHRLVVITTLYIARHDRAI
jgi:hypothetical protein